ncbi:glycoside hydrolase [Sistotremastrum niveocremeum HHB9708]|uniref:glucan 1,3-beta-glucosidase n=1 Tax=Sistotremastrum niveocremeum HHB9708 TaxID=1314777 RepID=A0A165AK06_9AGAM|nr:glycoside hydrolase [Sistotremastrum niveocremeum HHB9708]
MASNHTFSQSIPYNSLPGSSAAADQMDAASPNPPYVDHHHSAPPSPGALNIDDPPPVPAAPIPRFYGSALRDSGPQPYPRDSYASSIGTSHSPYASSDVDRTYTGSIQALNPTTEDLANYTMSSRGDYQYAGSPLMRESYRDENDSDLFYPPQKNLPDPSPLALSEKNALYSPEKRRPSKKTLIVGAVIGGLLLLILGVLVPVYFAVIRPHNSSTLASSNHSSSSSSTATSGAASPTPIAAIISGGDGSTVTTDDGSTFTYSNKFGGYWVQDPNNPFNNGARAQSWSPALNETFRYGIDKIRGVNLGGWLVTEPFIVPSLYETWVNTSTPAVDEWGLSANMAANNSFADLENHYATFITEQDFAEIAGAGLNFVRIPLAYWAIETRGDEPFLAKTSWTYFLKAIEWARKYGIRINVDLHAVPGSQNGWNHSGKFGSINFLNGVSGYFNAQRTLEYVRVIAEFISQPQYSDVVVMFGILNEPEAPIFGTENLQRWYLEAYNIVRKASGTGQGKGPYVSIHDGFLSPGNWVDVFPNADRMAIDTHPYICFGGQSAAPLSSYAAAPCDDWGSMMNDSLSNFGLSGAGEFSLATNDCGLWVNGVFNGSRYEGTYPANPPPAVGSCDQWNDWTTWNSGTKSALKNFAMSSMDALQNWFFWTWKIGNSTVTGKVESPFWSYQLGLQQGWIPTDPRSAVGTCQKLGHSADQFQPPLQSWQTGGAGAGNIPASVQHAIQWPPTTMSFATDVTLLPSYTPTGVNPTLPGPTFTPTPSATVTATTTVDPGSGWANPQDTQGAYVEITGCTYPDPWGGLLVPIPNAPCAAAGSKRGEAEAALITDAPVLTGR